MKTTIIILVLLSFMSCETIKSFSKDMAPYPFASLSELKHEYKLTDDQCGRIIQDAKSGKIASFWYDQRNQRCYNSNVNYNAYKY